MKRLIFAAIWFALIPPLLFAATQSARTPAVNYPLLTGAEVFEGPVVHPPYPLVDCRVTPLSLQNSDGTWFTLFTPVAVAKS